MKFYRATYDSSHFSFEAYGETEYLAVSALRAVLARHAKQYGCARGWYQPDDISAYPVLMGMGYRDQEVVR